MIKSLILTAAASTAIFGAEAEVKRWHNNYNERALVPVTLEEYKENIFCEHGLRLWFVEWLKETDVHEVIFKQVVLDGMAEAEALYCEVKAS